MTMSAEGTSPGSGMEAEELIGKIAQLTRMLRDSMRELGLDQAIKEAAEAIPDARDRLGYVARMTEQAANRVLNAAEAVQPLQETMQKRARELDARWQDWFDHPVELSEARELVQDTRGMLQEIPAGTQKSLDLLLEIIMAQDFQDLTGQVITRMLGVIGTIEQELVKVLIDNVPKEKREETKSLLNGPQTSPAGKPDVVASQDQVDDLLASLGF